MAKVIGHKQFVFIADCKAAAIATRAQIAAAGGRYCFPLPMTGQNPLWLKQWVLNQHQPSEEIFLPTQKEDEVAVAVGKGFEVELGKFWLNPDTKKSVHWHERYLVVYSNSFAAAQIRGQQQRLKRAETALEQLASNPGADLAQLNLKVKAILTRYQNQDRISGLMFLLSLALRVFTLIEFVVRQALVQTHQSLSGLYEGNPRRETKRPSTEQLLKAFRHLTLYCLPDLTFFITPLSELQRRILSLMNLSASLYQLHLKPCKT